MNGPLKEQIVVLVHYQVHNSTFLLINFRFFMYFIIFIYIYIYIKREREKEREIFRVL